MTFSLNLGTSIKNFGTNKYCLKRSFQKEYTYHGKKHWTDFFDKHSVIYKHQFGFQKENQQNIL